MRKIFFLLFLIFSTLVIAKISHASVNELDTTSYDAFGNSMDFLDTDTVLYVYRVGTSHASDAGNLYGIKYTVSSGTWGSPYLIYDDPTTTTDSRDPAIVVINGMVYCLFTRRNNQTSNFIDIGYIVSTDSTASSWSSYTPIFTPPSTSGRITASGGFNGHGRIIKGNIPGEYFWFIHGSDGSTAYEVIIIKTSDYGATWSVSTSTVFSATGGTTIDETSCDSIGSGKILCHSRVGAGGVMQQITSSDDGVTWATPAATNLGGTVVNVPQIYYDQVYDNIFASWMNRQSSGKVQYTVQEADIAFRFPTAYPTPTDEATGYTANGYDGVLRIDKNHILKIWSREKSASDADLQWELISDGMDVSPALTLS